MDLQPGADWLTKSWWDFFQGAPKNKGEPKKKPLFQNLRQI
jgi:hypothetical protein